MPRFSRSFTVPVPLKRVADFHHGTAALKNLTPPPLIVQLHEIEPLGEGSRSIFTLWFGPIPVRWVAEHSQVSAENGFVDSQIEGPFESWVHEHRFEAVNESSAKVTDTVTAEFGNGLLNGIFTRLMWLGLPVLFAFRALRTRQLA